MLELNNMTKTLVLAGIMIWYNLAIVHLINEYFVHELNNHLGKINVIQAANKNSCKKIDVFSKLLDLSFKF